MVIEPEEATLLVTLSTAALESSVNVVPSVLVYTRSELFRFPVLLFTSAQSKLIVPATLPVKSRKRSIAQELVLSVEPVERRTIFPVHF